jgi:hypothetical protein
VQGHALTRIVDEMVLLLGYLATPTGGELGMSVFAGWRNCHLMVHALCDLDVVSRDPILCLRVRMELAGAR